MSEFHIFHTLTLWFVSCIKWLELSLLKTFPSTVEKWLVASYRNRMGVGFYGAGVSSENQHIITDKEKADLNGNKNVAEKYPKNSYDLEVHNPQFFARIANQGSLGIGEAYMDGWWDCEDITGLSYRIFKSGIFLEYLNIWNRFLNYVQLSFFNLQSKSRAWEVGKKHYDIGNDLFEGFLDSKMNYSCGYWASANNLEEAQINKMELIAKKLKLSPGMKVLDIGCGWGGLVKYLAEKHGVTCVGITISEEGVKYGETSCAGLDVDFRLMDYRDLNEQFDRIVSVGMFEHVGRHNYRTFFEVVHKCLKDDGIFLLHTIGRNHSELPGIEPFFHKYIFPNGYLPYFRDITKFTESLYVIEDWHNFGHDYSNTLLAWNENFKKNWEKIEHIYGNRFFRMWTYYLQCAAGVFGCRKLQVWQLILSKNGIEGGYRSVR